MKLFLDDKRDPPIGWQLCTTAWSCIFYLRTQKVTEISLDHDLGNDSLYGTGYDVLKWIERSVAAGDYPPPKIHIHTMNPVARDRMLRAIESINKLRTK